MDEKLIGSGRARIALNMIGFGIAFGLCAFMLALPFMTLRGGGSGEAVLAIVLFFAICAVALYIMGRNLGGIVLGIAEIVRGVNTSRPAPPSPTPPAATTR
jgi:hypothetical protein